MRALEGHRAPVSCLAFSPDGRRLASGDDDGTVFLWDLPSGRAVHRLNNRKGSYPVCGLAFHPGGGQLACLHGRHLTFWDTGRRAAMFDLPAHSVCLPRLARGPSLAWACGLQVAVAAEQCVHLVRPAEGADPAAFWGGPHRLAATRELSARWAAALAASADGTVIAAGGPRRGGNRVAVWRLGDPGGLIGEEPDRVWQWPRGTLSGLSVRGDGGRLAACVGRALVVCDVESGAERFFAEAGSDAPHARCVAFSPRGAGLAAGGWDGRVRLYDPETLLERAAYQFHEGAVLALAFAPDGLSAASGGDDFAVRVWDVG